MAPKVIYQLFAKLLARVALRLRGDATQDIEILILRPWLAMLQRQTPRPRMLSGANWILLWLGPTPTPRGHRLRAQTGDVPDGFGSKYAQDRSCQVHLRQTAHAERNDR